MANTLILQALAAQAGTTFIMSSDDPTGPDNSQVLVGNDILQNVHMLIDYQSWQVYISKK
jgi:hypothetical protein